MSHQNRPIKIDQTFQNRLPKIDYIDYLKIDYLKIDQTRSRIAISRPRIAISRGKDVLSKTEKSLDK